MGNCFSGDDTSPENSAHQEEAVVDLAPNYNPRSMASTNTSPLNPHVTDPRLKRKMELLSEAIPFHGDEIMDMFRKIRQKEKRIGRSRFHLILKRSHSAGSAEAVAMARGIDLSEGDLKLERFKVKTLNVGDPKPVPPTGQGAAGKGGGGKK